MIKYIVTVEATREDNDTSKIPGDLFMLGVALTQGVTEYNDEIKAEGLVIKDMHPTIDGATYVVNDV